MKKAQKDRKRQADFTSGSESSKQLRFVKKNIHGSSQSSPYGQWRITSFQNKCSGNFQLSVRNVVPTLTSDKRQGLSLNGRC
jgi:hypothetical protein